ncbi:LytR/AlgR family response regulator transcription factor [Dyadobacter psychrophilus]|uniref:Two component transcriptional regulator, LytTR family n=1 Tax=Dyadobacter psychrophilus TaxID=651661 RepID=A0A1T5E1T3_9BACT|nr:LytTR family DNA-binding domain-containing protein [Dyadobacter psychrophilus]SKB77901.1 two component transcriptional regulator, LytTR family [Dyadobacter psychrophilus]
MKISCIIVEDEPLAMERARDYVLRVPLLDLLATFTNAVDAFSFLKSNRVDLVFLDINLGAVSGINLLESMRIDSHVIITTAYHEFALKGFELSVTDYLLKPFTFERFIAAVGKVETSLVKTRLPEKKWIFVKTDHRLEKVLLDDIMYIEGMRDYRRIHTTNKKIMTLQTFTDFEKEIASHIVCRVHKSFMVSLDKIETIEKEKVKINNIFIPISATYRNLFFRLLGK